MTLSPVMRLPVVSSKAGIDQPADQFLPATRKEERDANERRELDELTRHAPIRERNEKARARCADGGIDDDDDGGGGGGGGVGGILNLGGSIDFTIWTPPKVKNKPSRTYSTLIECLSSARLVSTHRLPEREKEGDARNETEQETEGKDVEEEKKKRRGRRQGTRKRELARGRNRVEARAGAAKEGSNKEEEGNDGRGDRDEKRVAKCRSSTLVRNKEQKIDRLLSFMFLRGRR